MLKAVFVRIWRTVVASGEDRGKRQEKGHAFQCILFCNFKILPLSTCSLFLKDSLKHVNFNSVHFNYLGNKSLL